MPETTKKSETLEILISTMNKDSLKFLEGMFPEDNWHDYNILIINQTTSENQLTSHYSNIRVINSLESGLPLSRNLAFKNAIGDICLIADDDVNYKVGFKETILNAFKDYHDADIITFKMVDEKGNAFKPYENIKLHNKKTIRKVNSVVIGLRLESIIEKAVFFNPYFGLGATFQTGDEYVFLRDALDKNLKIMFEPKVILAHNYNSSGRQEGSDRIIFARAALLYKYSGILAYLRILKYIIRIYKRGYLKVNQLLPKLFVGFRGISVYKKIITQNPKL